MYDCVVVGCGYAGAVSARLLAEQYGKTVLILERRDHIAGNMFDYYDENGILIHKYGPHISVMNHDDVYNFLSRFTDWIPYEHRVNVEIDGKEVPLPINFNSIEHLFSSEKANLLITRLNDMYRHDSTVPILELMNSKDETIRSFANFIYDKVFFHYTMKMWGLSPDKIDKAVTGRIPIRLSRDDRHFLHKYQVMPREGFTRLFKNMIEHPNIDIRLSIAADKAVEIDFGTGNIKVFGEKFDGIVVYTGALDELMNYKYGQLPYRSLRFQNEFLNADYIQATPVLNWPDDRPATRRTEMKRLTQQVVQGKTVTITEFPGGYVSGSKDFSEPFYPISEKSCLDLYKKYLYDIEKISRLIPTGRLADYKYYNMEDTILNTLAVIKKWERIIKR